MLGGIFDRLPCEILHSIALMLPFSSIVQLRRSSKFWYNLLTDPKFVDLHLTRAHQTPSYLLSANVRVYNWEKDCYFVEQSRTHLSASRIFNYSGDNEDHRGIRFESSGGLVCVHIDQPNYFRVFNPFIGEEVRIPGDPMFKTWKNLTWYFSFSPFTKEYKILAVGQVGRLVDQSTSVLEHTVGAIYTLGSSDNWRGVEDVSISVLSSSFIECQGNLFWMTKSGVTSFDLVSETFSLCPGPQTHLDSKKFNLLDMGHTIGCVTNSTLWELENRIEGIWIKKYDLLLLRRWECTGMSGFRVKDSMVGMLKRRHQFFSYDMKQGGRALLQVLNLNGNRESGMYELSGNRIEHVTRCVRSLVSPPRIMKMGPKFECVAASISDLENTENPGCDRDRKTQGKRTCKRTRSN